MNRENLKYRIMRINELNILDFREEQTKKTLIEPIFDNLGWDTSDPQEVVLEYYLPPEGRVDYAFLSGKEPVIFVEAKQTNIQLDNYSTQLLKYAFAKGVKLAVLTNGIEWWLYLPMEEGNWDNRKFFSVDLKKQDIELVCDRLIDFLSKENVLSGKSIQNAKEMRQSRERQIKINHTLPDVWKSIITEPNKALIDLLIDETERACGYKADEFTVKRFIAEMTHIDTYEKERKIPKSKNVIEGNKSKFRRLKENLIENEFYKGTWTKSELDLLKELFPNNSTSSIAKKLGRPNDAVKKKASRMGLLKSEQYMKSLGRNIQ